MSVTRNTKQVGATMAVRAAALAVGWTGLTLGHGSASMEMAAQGAASSAPPPPADGTPARTIDELIEINRELSAENERLSAEVARLNLELSTLRAAKEDLERFIADFKEYGTAFEQYTFFREKAEREEKARRAAEARARREAERQERLARREQARADDASDEDAADSELEERFDTLRRAGFTRVGETVFVGPMSYVYQTTEHEEIRYSPLIDFWYVDRDEEIDYSELTVSGSLVHAAPDVRNISIAIAFFDRNDAQMGSTTVRVDGARPGIPYPFTSTVKMAGNEAFKRYTSWVLYDDPAPVVAVEEEPAPTDEPVERDLAPQTQPSNGP